MTRSSYADHYQDPYGIAAVNDYAYPDNWGYYNEGANQEYYPTEPPPQADVLHIEEAPSPGTPDDEDDVGSTSDE